MKLDLLEPVRDYYKDEVRDLGRQLGIPASVLSRQPFPGPGQAIRILGEVTKERLIKQQQADQIVLSVMKETGWYDRVFQSFPVMTGVNTTAVKGDGRVYGELVGLRIYDSSDIMTAGWTHLPYEVLQKSPPASSTKCRASRGSSTTSRPSPRQLWNGNNLSLKIKGWVQINTVKACYNNPMGWYVRFFQTTRGEYPVKKIY